MQLQTFTDSSISQKYCHKFVLIHKEKYELKHSTLSFIMMGLIIAHDGDNIVLLFQ